MGTANLSAGDFADTVLSDGIVLVDFWAAARVTSRAFGPVLEAVARRHPDILLARVDTEAEPDLPAAVGVRSVPTLMVFRDGILVFAEPGAMPEDSVELLISTVRDLDMTAVRALFPGR